MKRGSLRPVAAALVAVAACIAMSPAPDAAPTVGPVESFVGRAVDVMDKTETSSPIEIMVERWSTPAELDSLRGTFVQGGPATLLPTLQKTWRRAGVVFTPGIMSAGARARTRRVRNLMFAREVNTPTGRQVIFAAREHLPLGERPAAVREQQPEFALIDIRFGPDGKGIGKIAPPSNVAYNKQTQMVEIANYATHPVRLMEVKSAKP
jgi:hypothetical protein